MSRSCGPPEKLLLARRHARQYTLEAALSREAADRPQRGAETGDGGLA
jgi:hypothetical protein